MASQHELSFVLSQAAVRAAAVLEKEVHGTDHPDDVAAARNWLTRAVDALNEKATELAATAEAERQQVEAEHPPLGADGEPIVETASTTTSGAPAAPAETPPATPAAEEHAAATGVDLSTVEGTGKDGTITKADVTAAAEATDTVASVTEQPS